MAEKNVLKNLTFVGATAAHKLANENKLEAMRRLEEERDYGVKLSLDENCRQIIEALNSGAGG